MQDWLQTNETPVPVCAQQQTPDLGRRMLAALTTAATGRAINTNRKMAGSEDCWTGEGSGAHRSTMLDAAAAAQPPAGSIVQLQQSSQAMPQQQAQQQQQQQQQQQACKEEYSAVMVIGTDIPDLSAAVLDAAAAALATHDVVLGPARDGGFYLMGFQTAALLRPEVQSGQVFASVQWSTGSVLQRTMAGVERLGLRLAPLEALPVLQDVDTAQDLQAWYQQSVLQQQQLPHACVPCAGGKQVQHGDQGRGQQHRQLLISMHVNCLPCSSHTGALSGVRVTVAHLDH
ncbi:hypothetical protein COO60DRAFT_1185371 [Scenedesmus sp. NREL 46B-D3]|nr:hypothetical protein COO60DRAFT_1185371 [Scenedesmus sp. NREL 46B-D3]